MFTKIIEAYKAHRVKQKAIRELERMTDKDLADIGIHRAQIKEVIYTG